MNERTNDWSYAPSHYHFRVMAWCKASDTFCVGLYGKASTIQTTTPYNYSAEKFSYNGGDPINGPALNLQLLDPLALIPQYGSDQRTQYIIVGDRATIGYIANYLQGNP